VRLVSFDKKTRSFETIPGRVFLDTCVVNMMLDYGEQIHDGVPIPDGLPERVREDIDALSGIFDTGRRAFWQLAISPHTYCEVTATNDARRASQLEGWFVEVWEYWRQFLRESQELPCFCEAEEMRVQVLSSGILEVLPDMTDRVLLCDAVVYQCDAFCTRDWSTILKFRDGLKDLPVTIFTPAEWWGVIRPWASIWL
jgi:hypothetical protein